MLSPHDQNPEPGPFTSDMAEHLHDLASGRAALYNVGSCLIVGAIAFLILIGPGAQNWRAVNSANQETCDAR